MRQTNINLKKKWLILKGWVWKWCSLNVVKKKLTLNLWLKKAQILSWYNQLCDCLAMKQCKFGEREQKNKPEKKA